MTTKNGIPIRPVSTKACTSALAIDAENISITGWFKTITNYLRDTRIVKDRLLCQYIAAFSRHNEHIAFNKHDNSIRQLSTMSKEKDAADDLIVKWFENNPQYKKYIFATNDKGLITRLQKIAKEREVKMIILYTNISMVHLYEDVPNFHFVTKKRHGS